MKKQIILIVALLVSLNAFSQNKLAKKYSPIVKEGKLLYKSEMASWYGTDLFLEQYKNKANIGGYFSYVEDERSICVFFSKESNDEPMVIGTITFDKTYNPKTAKTDLSERKFTNTEKSLYTIRNLALEEINSDIISNV